MNKLVLQWGSRTTKEIPLLDILTFLYFTSRSFTNFATALNLNTTLVAGIIYSIFFVIFGLYFFTHLNEIRWDGIILILLCALLFIVTINIHPEYSDRFNDIYNDGRFSAISVFSLGAGIYTYYIIRMYGDNLHEIYRTFRIIPYFIFILNIPTMIVRSSDYAMDFGYQMEIAAILFLAQYLYENKKRYQLVFSFVAMLLGVLYGSRACILGFLFFCVLYLIWQKKATIRSMFLLGFGIVVGVIFSSQTLMYAIYQFFLSLGMDSRTLYRFATGTLSLDSARQERIWPILTDLLQNSSIFKAYGAYGDRYYLPYNFSYAHNIVLEILVTFGILIGALILIWMLYSFMRTCIRNHGEGGVLTLAFGCFALCRLMVSSSFWIEPYFWAFLAIMVDCKFKSQKEATENRKNRKEIFNHANLSINDHGSAET